MKKSVKNIFRRMTAFVAAAAMAAAFTFPADIGGSFSGFGNIISASAEETSFDVGSTADIKITEPGNYKITGERSDAKAKIIVDCNGTVNLKFISVKIKGTSGNVIEIKSGTVNLELDGENLLEANQDYAKTAAVKMSDNAVLNISATDGIGSIKLHGSSNYWGGGPAVEGGSLNILSGNVMLIGGSKIQNSFGYSFDGKNLNIEGGNVSVSGGGIDDKDKKDGYISVSEKFSLSASANFTVPENGRIEIGSTASAVIDGTLTNNGTITNNDSIVNNSTVTGSGKIYNENGGTTTGAGTYATNPITVGTDFKITPASSGNTLDYGADYTYENNVLKIMSSKPITIANTNTGATSDRIEVANGVSADITLAGVNIDVSGSGSTAAFKIADNSTGNVKITLVGENTLESREYCAGLQKNGDSGKLTITGTGSLSATGGECGAGIGGGWNGSGTNITISGGTVTATGGYGSAGIGGGYQGSGTNITISGGSVKASSVGCTPTDGNENVYRLEIGNEAGADININGKEYPTNHNGENKIYAYLPAKTADVPNVVKVGSAATEYCYDTTGKKWLKVVDIPDEDTNGFTYNGSEQTYSIAESDHYTVNGNKQTDAGTYTVTVSLNDNTNTVWSDGTIGDKEYTFEIGKKVAPTINNTTKSYNWGVTGQQETAVSGLPDDMGKIGTITAKITSDDNSILTADSASFDINSGTLDYKLGSNTSEKIGSTATVKVTIPSQNYEDIVFNVIVEITDKNTRTEKPDCILTLSYDSSNNCTATIAAVEGAEYSFDGKNWSDTNTTSVAHGETVTGYIRYKETDDKNASDFNSDSKTADRHSYGTEWKSDSTSHWHECECGEKAEITAHTFGEWKITVPATTEADGKKVRSCTVCGYAEEGAVRFDGSDENDGDITNTTDSGSNALHADIDLSNTDIIRKIPLTPEEQEAIVNGAELTVYMVVIDYSGKVSAEDKELSEAALPDGSTIGMYIDVNLFKKVGNNAPVAVHNTNGGLKITFDMPQSLINANENYDRTYSVIRAHDGKAEVLECSFDAAVGKASFITDKFSSYAIAYKDTENSSAVPDSCPIITGSGVTTDKAYAAAGETVNVKTSFGYDIIVTDADGRQIAKITEKGSFVMPDGKVYVTAVRNETFAMMSNSWNHSYVYSYDSDMNRIKISSDSKRGVITIKLGKEYAGREFVIYSGRKSTREKITEGVLDAKGNFTFKAEEVKNYTLVIK